MATPTELATAAGISLPYASQLLSGRRRPSMSMALQIYQRAGMKLGPIAQASDETIAELIQLQDAA